MLFPIFMHSLYCYFTQIIIDLSENSDVLKVNNKSMSSKGSTGLQLTFKVRTAHIFRPWFDSSLLNIERLSFPGMAVNSWSTGEIHESNDGIFPLMSTQIVVAKNITLKAAKLNDEIKQVLFSDRKSEIKLVNTDLCV